MQYFVISIELVICNKISFKGCDDITIIVITYIIPIKIIHLKYRVSLMVIIIIIWLNILAVIDIE